MNKIPLRALIRIALGSLFLWAGLAKLIEPWQNFQAVVEAYRMVEGAPARWIAQIFPWIEAVGGLYLVFGLYTRASTTALWALNTSFLAALISAVARKLPLRECGCFGDAFSMPPKVTLAFDIVLWFGLGSLFLWEEQAKKFSLDLRYAQTALQKPVSDRKS